jgi:hypothetical protein
MSLCPKCQVTERDEGQSYCAPCRASYQRIRRALKVLQSDEHLEGRVAALEDIVFKHGLINLKE